MRLHSQYACRIIFYPASRQRGWVFAIVSLSDFQWTVFRSQALFRKPFQSYLTTSTLIFFSTKFFANPTPFSSLASAKWCGALYPFQDTPALAFAYASSRAGFKKFLIFPAPRQRCWIDVVPHHFTPASGIPASRLNGEGYIVIYVVKDRLFAR